jgi:hypothetical protein
VKRRFITLAGALALAAAAAGAGPARAAGGLVTGVWWRAQSDGGTLPAPPTVSSHQLWVSSDPSGASAVSALHLDLSPDEAASGLTLRVVNLTTAPATPVAPVQAPVLACPTTSKWKPVDASTPGAWSAQPKYDCSKGQVQGAYSGDLKSMVFDLTPLAVSGTALDVALVPGLAPSPVPGSPAPLPVTPPATGNQPATFDETFDAPKVSDITIDHVAVASDTSEAADDTADTTAPAFSSPAPVLPAVTAPSSLGGPIGPTAGVSNPLGAPLASVSRPYQSPALAKTSRDSARVLAGLVFLALCGWAWQQFAAESATAGRVRRPRLTLYDVPPAPVTRATTRHFAHTTREGRPPPLR